MVAFQRHMDVTAHNIANVSTKGYKGGRSSFSDLLYTNMDVNTPGQKLEGHGVKHAGTDLLLDQGSLSMTGQELDFAIVGEGFFALDDGEGGRKYTRNGNFTISVEGNKAFLVSRLDGCYVLDERGRRIQLSKKDNSEVYNTGDVLEKLGVYSFSNPYGLERANGSCFTETDISGRAKSITGEDTYEIRGFTLENSSVNIGDEMMNIIQSQRAFQMNSKIVQTADQIEEIINNLR